MINPQFGEAWRKIVACLNVGTIRGERNISYSVMATMMSGEQTTAFFNLILNHIVMEYAQSRLNFFALSLMEGDDAITGSTYVRIPAL
jgi:hypothetical protein